MPHIHELFDFVVTVLIVHEGRVLLVHHKSLKQWLPVGGHVELDENPEQAVFREAKEECGLEIEIIGEKPQPDSIDFKPLFTPSYLDVHRINDHHWHINLTYFAKTKSNNAQLAVEEHNEIRWFTEEDLKNPEFAVKPDVVFYALEALRKVR